MSLRDEFLWSKIGFKDVCFERFFTLQWRSPGILFVIYRLLVASYTISILALGARHFHQEHPNLSLAWGAFLTNWTYSLLSIYFSYQALLTVSVYLCCSGLKLKLCKRMDCTAHKYIFTELFLQHTDYQQVIEGAENDPMDIVDRRVNIPWYACISWILLNTASVAALLVTCVFWAALVPLMPGLPLANQENLQFHLINSLLILLEQFLCALPVRLLHIVFPLIYCSIYCIFSVFYWASDHSHVMYPILDWGKSPWLATGCVLIIGIVLVPLLQFFLYGIYRLKLSIFYRCCWN